MLQDYAEKDLQCAEQRAVVSATDAAPVAGQRLCPVPAADHYPAVILAERPPHERIQCATAGPHVGCACAAPPAAAVGCPSLPHTVSSGSPAVTCKSLA